MKLNLFSRWTRRSGSMGRMRRYFAGVPGQIGTGFIACVSGFARRVLGCLTKSLYVLTLASIDLIPLFVMLLIVLPPAFCLCRAVELDWRKAMALPVSQGGIDYPDGGFTSGQGGFPMIGDLAELAARLDSINAYDRRGTVVWMTDFERGLQGVTFTSDHADSVGSLSAARAFHGSFSAKFDPRDAEGSYVRWSRVLGLLPTGPIGTEISVSLDDSPDAIRLTMWYRDGGRELYAPLVYETVGGLWKIRDKDLGWVTVLSGFQLETGANAWHQIKLVIDAEEKTYVRLLASKHTVKLDGYNLVDNPSEDLGQLYTRVTVYGSPARHAPVYLDGVIVTQSES